MLIANSAAILTDAFPREQRGMALGVNQIAALAGQFLGLVAGGLLAEIDWRAVFWVSVPFGLFGTVWSIRSLREVRAPRRARIDWGGNITFAVGTASLLAAITYGIQPYGGAPTGWGNPVVLGGLGAGVLLLVAFCVIETRVADPMFDLSLFRIRAFSAGNLAALLTAMARGGLQFMLIIWLQGIWLPLHGYDFESTPLWAGIFMLPLTAGFLIAGPTAGYLSDRFGARLLSTGGLLLVAASFLGLLALPVDFSYPAFAALLVLSGIGQGVFSAPNTSAIMSSVPEHQRGVASGMRSTFQNSGTALSIGVFFSLMVAGLARSLPDTLTAGLQAHGVPAATAEAVATPAAGEHPVRGVPRQQPGGAPARAGRLAGLAPADAAALTGTEFFPRLITEPFHHGLVTVFTAAAAMALVAAVASASRGRRYFHQEPGPTSRLGRAADQRRLLAAAGTLAGDLDVDVRHVSAPSFEVEVEDLGDDLPPTLDVDQGEQVGEVLRADGALDAGEGRHGTGEVDRRDTVGTRLASRRGDGRASTIGKYSPIVMCTRTPSVADA